MARRLFVTACLVVAFATLAPAASAGVPYAKLSIGPPAAGPPTSSNGVSGMNFGASESVTVTFGSTTVATATTDANGGFEVGFQVPADATPGTHEVTATGTTSGRQAFVPFEVRTDWTEPGFTAANTGYNRFENVLNVPTAANLGVRWAARVGAGYTSPAVVNHVLYFTTLHGVLKAADASTGSVRWAADVSATTSPAVSNGIVVVASSDGVLYGVQARTGDLQWSFTNGSALSTPNIVAGNVYVGDAAGTITVINVKTGAVQWSLATPATGIDAVTLSRGGLYFTAGATVYAVDLPTRTVMWSFPTPAGLSAPVVDRGIVYFGTSEEAPTTTAYAVRASSGHLLWSNVIPKPQFWGAEVRNVAVANGMLFVASWNGTLYAFDVATGATRWTQDLGPMIAQPVVANGVVYESNSTGSLSTSEGTLFAVNESTGSVVWSHTTQGFCESSVAVSDGVVYLASQDRYLYAFGT
jgi:outer membrane protein assembly factor BamB